MRSPYLSPLVAFLLACGNDSTGPAEPLTFAVLDAGSGHTCAITTTEAAYCWGEYTGNDTFPQSNTPRRVAGGHIYAGLSTQWLHVCGVTPSAEAYCWGENFTGTLGDSTTVSKAVPVRVAGQ